MGDKYFFPHIKLYKMIERNIYQYFTIIDQGVKYRPRTYKFYILFQSKNLVVLENDVHLSK